MQILARVAELADALGSGPSEGNFIGVQVPFRAKKEMSYDISFFINLLKYMLPINISFSLLYDDSSAAIRIFIINQISGIIFQWRIFCGKMRTTL